MLRWSLVLLLLLAAGLLAWHHVSDYRASAAYRCDGAAELRLSHPPVPLIGEYLFVDSLELYIGGWLERGSLTIRGDVLDGPILVTAEAAPTRIAFSRGGEWYQPDFKLTFEPSETARCFLRVVYKFRGVF